MSRHRHYAELSVPHIEKWRCRCGRWFQWVKNEKTGRFQGGRLVNSNAEGTGEA